MIGTAGRRAFLALAAAALVWALAVQVTGGIAIETSWRPISSRNAVRPLVAGIALLALYVVAFRRHWRADLGRLTHATFWPRVLAGLATLAAIAAGLGWGTRIAAGPDPSGYASQAALYANGGLTVPTPAWAQNAPWDDAAASASPIGWLPTRQTPILAPFYSPGLPMIMALVQLAAGPDAVFYVVPALGALLVWSSYWLGRRAVGPWAGAIAAILVASSPTFLAMQLQVMSDVPVAAFLTLSLAASLTPSHPWIAGVAAAAAVLTRPNLAPLVVVPFVLLAAGDRRPRWLRAFVIPVAIACAIVAALNYRYHGSPFTSGYGSLAGYYALAHVEPNARNYSRWFIELHSPAALAAVAGAVLAGLSAWRIALIAVAIPAALLAIYLPFLVFHPNDWYYTRFLLPGYAALFTGLGAAAAALAARPRLRKPAVAAAAAVVVVLAAHGWTVSIRNGVFRQRDGDARFAWAVDYARRLPERSILISNAHSGTLRFYTGRDVLRFEAIRPGELDTAVAHLQRSGYHLFLVGDLFEIEEFRTLFAATRTVAAAHGQPRAAFAGVEIYEIH